MSRAEPGPPALTPPRAALLGALHGVAELLPISSSAHMTLIPWLLGWSDEAPADADLEKAFVVALHAGTAAGLLIALRPEIVASASRLERRRGAVIALATVVPAAAGYTLERPIEERCSGPGPIAAALLAGSVVFGVAERAPQRRAAAAAEARDGAWLGVAQAVALIPGVSRGGATAAAARLLGFARADASRLSRDVALPVIAGATALKAWRLSARGLPPGTLAPFAVGAAAACASTVACAPLARRSGSLVPYAVYRALVAGVVVLRLRRSVRRTGARTATPPAGRPPAGATAPSTTIRP